MLQAMAKPIPPDHEVGKTTLDEPQAQEDIPDEAEGMPPAAANHDELKPENLTTDTVPETKTAEEDEDVKLDVVIVPDESAVIRDEFIEQEVTSSSEVVKEEVMVETAEADSTELPLPQVPHVQHSDPEPPQQVPVVSTTSGLSSQVTGFQIYSDSKKNCFNGLHISKSISQLF